MSQETLLITGAAGFIGFHLAKLCLDRGHRVIGLDNLNDYYDPKLKLARVELLRKLPGFEFEKASLEDGPGIKRVFDAHRPTHVVNLAAQAGVRYSLENPRAYIDANIVGFLNILEACRAHAVEHLAYASSSSVYGSNTHMPFSVHDNVDHPLSLYAASKKSNELMAHTYSHLFRIPTTGLRFFTVYGPWGRPDMALFKFTASILAGKPIDVFNGGLHKRDFTYIDDIAEGVYRATFKIPQADPAWDAAHPDPATSAAPYRLYNIGNSAPVELMHFIRVLEAKLGKQALLNMLPLQPGDVPATEADVTDLMRDVGFKPDTSVETGIGRFVDWYRGYYGA
ncbi:MAG: NAD-dependent epimerase [Fibrobacteria bacterium]